MMDKIFAVFALLLFASFVGVLIVKVHILDLWIVLLGVVALAAFDFWRTLRQGPEPLDPTQRP